VAVLLVAIALGLAQSWTMIFIVPLAFLIGSASPASASS
jgi:hypothetical protein